MDEFIHRELSSEPIDKDHLLMCWLVYQDEAQGIELGVWKVPENFDPDNPGLIPPQHPIAFPVASLPAVLALARTAVTTLNGRARLPDAMPRGQCGMLAVDAPMGAMACRGPDGADFVAMTWGHEVSDAVVPVPLAKAGALVKVLAGAVESFSPGSSRLN